MKNTITNMLRAAGATDVGVARIDTVDDAYDAVFRRWLDADLNGALGYMRNHAAIRRDPALLLPGARSVIVATFGYYPEQLRDPALPTVAKFAYGEDYHKVLRRRLKPVVSRLRDDFGATSRICVDSAPIHEKYWALRAGIGRRGRNSLLISDSLGSYFFIAEIITTLDIEPDEPSVRACIDCGRCVRECPTGAITQMGIDARKCLSAVTIEEGRAVPGVLFGCDRCQDCCPHNEHVRPTAIAEFRPSAAMLTDPRPQIPNSRAADKR